MEFNLEFITYVLFVSAGLAMLYFGAEWLIRGSVVIANKFKISQLVIGLTIVAFGTSTPELAVSISSAIQGISDVALGNVVGSNIVNVGLILGISAFLAPISVAKQTVRREIPIMIGVSLLLLAISVDGQISTIDGLIFLAGIVIFTLFSYKSIKKENKEVPQDSTLSKKATFNAIFLIGIGLGVLTVGAFLTVDNAVRIAHDIGLSERIIGLTLVAIGTSLPELITSVVAAKKGHVDLSVGNIIGSNVFNILAILGISASIVGITVSQSIWTDYFVMLGFALVLLPIMKTGLKISKIEGLVLVIGYVIYTGILILMK